MKIPHPIPYQGSKRNLASQIMRFFPNEVNRLVEPFAGSAAISIASAFYCKADRFWINDINTPLTQLWEVMIEAPDCIAKQYHEIWVNQLDKQEEHYYHIRELFNKKQKPEHLLFLLAKCVKAAIRYNASGEFNQSPDKRRKGRKPENMRTDIFGVSNLLKGKTKISALSYKEVFDKAMETDLLYLDPPYQGTGKNGGFRYFEDVRHDDFVDSLFSLNNRKIPFLLSYDGRTGTKVFGKPLPTELGLVKIELNAGRSSIATLHSRKQNTFEALYISTYLAAKIDLEGILNPKKQVQATLFD